jgi:hypothetical protein
MQVPQQALARDAHVELGGEGGKARRAARVPRLEAPDAQESRADADRADETGACMVVRGRWVRWAAVRGGAVVMGCGEPATAGLTCCRGPWRFDSVRHP